jgi:invasion protein IalB
MTKINLFVEGLLALILCNGIADAATLWPSFPSPQVSQLDKPKGPPPTNGARTPATQPPATQPPAAQPPAGQGWVPKCVSASRHSPVECSVEETLVMANTGQPVSSVIVQIPANEKEPTMIIRLPTGLYLAAGVTMQIDDDRPQAVPLQSCDAQSCFAQMPLNPNVLGALKGGKKLSITVQNLAKNNVVFPFPLSNFADAFQNIQ